MIRVRFPLDPRTIRPADRMRPHHELSSCQWCERKCWRMHEFACDDCAQRIASARDREVALAGGGSLW